MPSSIILWSFIHGGSLTLYSSFWTILILHLLIIWVTTWVLPIRHPLWPSVSYGSQGNTVPSTFMMHVSLSGISYVTLSNKIDVWSVLCLFEETFLLGPHFLTFPFACYLWNFELNILTIVYSYSDQSTSSA